MIEELEKQLRQSKRYMWLNFSLTLIGLILLKLEISAGQSISAGSLAICLGPLLGLAISRSSYDSLKMGINILKYVDATKQTGREPK